MMKKNEQHPLVGRWHSPEWSSVEIVIKPLKKTMHIKAIDHDDGEKLQIKNKEWDGKTISFDLYTPSTGHTCHHVLTYKGSGKADFQMTWTEEWRLKDVNKSTMRSGATR